METCQNIGQTECQITARISDKNVSKYCMSDNMSEYMSVCRGHRKLYSQMCSNLPLHEGQSNSDCGAQAAGRVLRWQVTGSTLTRTSHFFDVFLY